MLRCMFYIDYSFMYIFHEHSIHAQQGYFYVYIYILHWQQFYEFLLKSCIYFACIVKWENSIAERPREVYNIWFHAFLSSTVFGHLNLCVLRIVAQCISWNYHMSCLFHQDCGAYFWFNRKQTKTKRDHPRRTRLEDQICDSCSPLVRSCKRELAFRSSAVAGGNRGDSAVGGVR